MLAIARVLRARRRGTDQSGFALATAIAILGVASLLVTAMLGLSFATATFSGDQVNRDRETHAAESAMEPAIGMLARAQPVGQEQYLLGQQGTPVPSDPNAVNPFQEPNPCAWVPDTANGQTEANRKPLVENVVDGKRVSVFCTALGADTFAPVTPTGSTVKVLGQVPAGNLTRTNVDPCQPLAECLPWREALRQTNVPAFTTAQVDSAFTAGAGRNGVGLVHSGPDPLQFVGNVDVSGGAAVLRNPDRGTGTDYVVNPPALAVSGGYRQGDPGLFSTLYSNPANPCGVLNSDPQFVPSMPGAQVSSGANIQCDQALLRGDRAATKGVVPAATQVWTQDRIRQNDVTVSRLPIGIGSWTQRFTPSRDCPVNSGASIQFRPGAYPANITSRLNAWFAGCAAVKFWFPPGSYWFDAANADGNALNLRSSSNLYVFGTPNAGDINSVSKSTTPGCNPAAPGVHVVLSPRTVFNHEAGYLALCGDAAAAGRQALWQDATANLGFQSAAPTTFQGGTASTGWFDGLRNIFLIGSLVNFIFGPGSPFTTRWTSLPGGGLSMTTSCVSAPCNGTAAFSTTWAPPAGQDPGPATINAATLRITGDETSANDVWNGALPATEVLVYLPDPATGNLPVQPTCRITSPRINDSEGRTATGPQTVDIDIIGPNSPCGGQIDRADLLKGRVDVAMGLNSECNLLGIFVGCTYGVRIDKVELQTPQVIAPPVESLPSFVGSPNEGEQVNPTAVLAADGNSAQFTFKSRCRNSIFGICIIYRVPDSGTGTIRLPALTDRYAPSLSDSNPAIDGSLTSASLRVRGISSCDNFHFLNIITVSRIDCIDYAPANNSPSRLRATVTRNGTTVCTASWDRLPEWNQTRSYDLLNSCTLGGTKRLRKNSDLIGTDIDVAFDMVRDRSFNYGCRNGADFPGNGCNFWRYSVDYVGLSTTVSTVANQSFDGPGPVFRITSNDISPSNREARFNVYGAMVLPRSDLRVEWIGPANRIGDPIVTGPPTVGNNRPLALMVGSLQSIVLANSGSNPLSAADDPRAGIVCCERARPAERVVELRSVVVPQDARLTLPTQDPANPANPAPANIQDPGVRDCGPGTNPTSTNGAGVSTFAVPEPPAVVANQGVAAVRRWKAQWLADWKTVCRDKALRATAIVRIVDQIPANISPTQYSASVYALRGTWVPGWDVEVQDWRLCRGGTSATDCTTP